MSDPTLEADVAAYLQRPVTGERLPSTHRLSVDLVGLLHRMAAERGVPVDALVEFLLFKQVRAEQARRMVGEPLEPVPASFVDDAVARAKADLQEEVARVKASHEQGGDKAQRLVAGMQAALDDAEGTDRDLEELRRRSALDEAKIDLALEAENHREKP